MEKRAVVFLLEDKKLNIHDIKRSLIDQEIEIVAIIEPESFFQAIYQAIFDLPDGILIDIDLRDFNIENIELGGKLIDNGIDIARFLFEFNSTIPIGVYSTNLRAFSNKLSTLDESIMRIEKDERSFKEILNEFRIRVQEAKNRFDKFKNLFSYSVFKSFSPYRRHLLLANRINQLTTDLYFETLGDYGWFITGQQVIRELHGPKIPDTEELQKAQLSLPNQFELDIVPELNVVKLERFWKEEDYLPIPFFNLRSPHFIEAIKAVYAKELLAKPSIWNFVLSYQISMRVWLTVLNSTLEKAQAKSLLDGLDKESTRIAQLHLGYHLAEKAFSDSLSLSQLRLNVSQLKRDGQLAFQQQLLLAKCSKINHPAEIADILGPFSSIFDYQITDIFKGEIDDITEDKDHGKLAHVLFENIFRKNVKQWKAFKFRRLHKEGIEKVGDRFLYVFFEDRRKNELSRYIRLLQDF